MPKIGRYEIESEIGRGSMGVVYLAHDPHVRRRVAVKVFQLPQGLSSTQEREYKERFLREAQAAGALSHPAIVTIYDADADPERGLPYIAMEYVEGSSLRQLLATEGRLDFDRVFAMGEILADALKTAHDAGVVHRDIKPANILVRSRDGAVKIADFGVARLATSDLTGVGDIFGSPAYMSPEQFRGAPVDARSDLFSLATILYQALCGERPFPGEDVSSIAYAVAHSIHPPPSTRRGGLPPELDRFFDRALAKDPAERFPDGATFKRALSDLKHGRSISGPAHHSTSGVSTTDDKGEKTRTPLLKLKLVGRDVSALEGAFAIAMLLLALLPGLWVLRGTTSKSPSGRSDRGPAVGGMIPEVSLPDGDGTGTLSPGATDSHSPASKAAEKGRTTAAWKERAANPSRAALGGGQHWSIQSEAARRGVSEEEIRREAEVNGWALAPDRSSTSAKSPPASPLRRGSDPSRKSASGETAPGARRGSPRDASLSSRTVPAYGSQTHGTPPGGSTASGSAAPSGAGERNPDPLVNEIARLEAPVRKRPAGSEEKAVLLIDAKSTIKSGVLRIFVDGKEAYTRQLSNLPPEKDDPSPKKAWFKRRQERFEARIEVSAGEHEIIAQVLPEGMDAGYKETTVVHVKPSETFKLQLVAGRLIGSPLSFHPD